MKAVVLFFVVGFVRAADLPAIFPRCSLSQDNLEECLINSAEKILKLLSSSSYEECGLNKLEPIHLPRITIPRGQSSLVDFDQTYEYINYWGFTNATFSKFRLNLEEMTIGLKIFFQQIRTDFGYDFNGEIASKPILGKGKGHGWFDKLEFDITLTIEEFEFETKTYYRIIDSYLSSEIELIGVKLDNLFDGDVEKGEYLNNYINENMFLLYDDVKSKYEELFTQIVVNQFHSFLTKVPIDSLFTA